MGNGAVQLRTAPLVSVNRGIRPTYIKDAEACIVRLDCGAIAPLYSGPSGEVDTVGLHQSGSLYQSGGRRCRCGTWLAQDNLDERCAGCQRASEEGGLLSPPVVSDEFWEYPVMQDALACRHMGRVIRAFREHPLHGRLSISQSTVAAWIGITQAQVSRIETGSPIVDIDRLVEWALLLRIPEKYLWFSLPKDGDVKRSRFLRLGGLMVTGIAAGGMLHTRLGASLTDRDCAQWLAWELWQRGESALHVAELPLSIARYLGPIDTDGRLVQCLNVISPDGHILCDKDGYCFLAHPSLVDFYVAQRLFVNIATGERKLLATAQTTHATDLVLQGFVCRHQSSVKYLREWMTKGADAVLRVNSAGILAKLGKSAVADVVIMNLKADRDSRQLYLTAVSHRVLSLEWNRAAQFAARVECPESDTCSELNVAQLAALAHELTNPRDCAARWCSALLLGYFQGDLPDIVRSALHGALQAELCRENVRAIGTVLAGNNPLTV